MKFVLFVEGHTEQKAVPALLKRWIDPRRPDYELGITKQRCVWPQY